MIAGKQLFILLTRLVGKLSVTLDKYLESK